MDHRMSARGGLPEVDFSCTAFFLDFDGTLAPIVERPEHAALPPGMDRTLIQLHESCGGALALISGRALDDLDARIAPLVFPAAGSHGLERRTADGTRHAADLDSGALNAVIGQMDHFASKEGLLLERKPGGASLHFRLAPQLEAASRRFVDDITKGEHRVRVIHGHMVAEVVSAGKDKGRALESFMTEAPFAGRVPVAAGDDTTDEDAFRAAQTHGGFAVRIGSADTCAHHRVADITAFHQWLHGLVAVHGS